MPYIRIDNRLFILYEFIKGDESDPDRDIEVIGRVIGKLHDLMKKYPGELIGRNKHFFVDRYIDILKRKQYPKADEFLIYGNALWDRIRNLPRGYCHGDMYSGNIHKTSDSEFYILDFDTSCEGFPMYDITLICNRTHYFNFDENGYIKSKEMLLRLLPEYSKHNTLTSTEINAFYDLIALYHFTLQATVIENLGLDCVDNIFLDKQLDWLYRWQQQCEKCRI